jgi:hypothetical protein
LTADERLAPLPILVDDEWEWKDEDTFEKRAVSGRDAAGEKIGF